MSVFQVTLFEIKEFIRPLSLLYNNIANLLRVATTAERVDSAENPTVAPYISITSEFCAETDVGVSVL